MLSADLCNPFGVTKVRSCAFPGSSASAPEEQPGAVSSLEGDGAALSSPAKCPPSLRTGVISAEVQLCCCKYRARQCSDRAPLITETVFKTGSTCCVLSNPMWTWGGRSRWCLLGGWAPLLAARVGPARQHIPAVGGRVVMGLKSQLDSFITINIICSYAGHGYDTNN